MNAVRFRDPKPHPHDSTLGESSREAQSGRRLLGGKARRGQVSYSTYVQMMVVLLDTTQSHKELWSGPQLRPLVLCLSVTSHSRSEEPGPHHLHLSALFSSSDYPVTGPQPLSSLRRAGNRASRPGHRALARPPALARRVCTSSPTWEALHDLWFLCLL